MTEVQAAELLAKMDTLLLTTADILAVNQHNALTMMMLCGLVVAGFLAVLFLGGFK